jgi:predicted enzyme related to lactoylglutathione lyase
MTPTFDFVEIRTRDLDRCQAFYGEVFGWNLQPFPGPVPSVMAYSNVMPVVGLMQVPQEVPLAVVPYVTVADCESAARRAVELGGTQTLAKQAVQEMGWCTSVVDPWGNEVAFWQERDPDHVPQLNEGFQGKDPVCWVELLSQDLEGAVSFWKQVVGWGFQVMEGVDDYAFVEGYPRREVSGVAGAGILTGEAAGMARGANVYVSVEDLGATEARVTENGGRVIMSRVPVPGMGHFSLFLDPEGNRLAIMEMGATS